MREALAQILTFAAFLAASGLGGWVVLRVRGEESKVQDKGESK